jgi:hypothetical protein
MPSLPIVADDFERASLVVGSFLGSTLGTLARRFRASIGTLRLGLGWLRFRWLRVLLTQRTITFFQISIERRQTTSICQLLETTFIQINDTYFATFVFTGCRQPDFECGRARVFRRR